jgi:hypothetical protein
VTGDDQTPGVTRPPLGLRPRFIVAEHRVAEIDAAIQRYEDAGWEVPAVWTAERAELLSWLSRNTSHGDGPSGQTRDAEVFDEALAAVTAGVRRAKDVHADRGHRDVVSALVGLELAIPRTENPYRRPGS